MGGDRLGRYTVLRHFASGGMADVLLARADGIEGFERHVVLKRIRREFAKDQLFIRMFVDEARIAATLHHQNVVQVTDIGEVDGSYYFAMEYIHGEDLRGILHRVKTHKKHVPIGHVIAIASQAAAGLHYAHERCGPDKQPLNIVHRDVSLSNIIVGYDGAVKVVDFGIAKAAMNTTETKTGSLRGKVPYMSPEQCRGRDIDRRSDIYSLGVVLYELATTSRLFKGGDYDTMAAIVHGEVPRPQLRRPEIPDALEAVIMRAISCEPPDRFQTADEMCGALDAAARDAGGATSTVELARYLGELFGARPEPWLEPRTDIDGPPLSDDAAKEETSRLGAYELARASSEFAPRKDFASGSDNRFSAPGGKVAPPARSPSKSRRWLAAIAIPAFALGAAGIYVVGRDAGAPASRPSVVVAADSPRVASEVPAHVAPRPTPAPAPVAVQPSEEATHSRSAPVSQPGAAAPPARDPAARNAETEAAQPRTREPDAVDPRARAPKASRTPEAASPRSRKTGEPAVASKRATSTPSTAAAASASSSPTPPGAPQPPPTRPAAAASPSPPSPPAVVAQPSPSPPPALLTPRIASVDTQGSLSPSVVRRAVDRVASAIARCTEKGSTRTVQVRFTIDESRRARNVRGNASACVAAAIAGVRTEAAPDVGDVEVTVQLALEARP